MATGACGINCNVCKLYLKGNCSTCGPGTSVEAGRKLAAQKRILGDVCAVLACAHLNHIDHCMCSCASFPCDNFKAGPYPFSSGFLHMQQRRLNEKPPAYAPDGSHLEVAEEYWQAAGQKNQNDICNLTFFEMIGPGKYQYRFLNEDIQIDLTERCLLHRTKNSWQIDEDPLLALVTVMYLKNVQSVYPLGRDIIGIRDLKEHHFFAGPHALRIDPLLVRYGDDLEGFKKACVKLGGQPVEMADAAFRLLPFPRVPLYFLLWVEDHEYKSRIRVLFDRSIENIFAADAIWALINRVAMAFACT